MKLIVENIKTGEKRPVDITNVEFSSGEDVLPDVESVRADLFSVAKALADWSDVPDEDIDVLFEDGEKLIDRSAIIDYPESFPLARRREIGQEIINYVSAKPKVEESEIDWLQRLEGLRRKYIAGLKAITVAEFFNTTFETVYNVGFRVGQAYTRWPNDEWFSKSPEAVFDKIWSILVVKPHKV